MTCSSQIKCNLKRSEQMSNDNESEQSPITLLKVSLHPVTEQDLEVLFTHQSDTIANQLAQFPPRNREVFLAHWQQNILYNQQVLARAIWVDGMLVGNILNFQHQGQSQLGYWIGREYWGQGIVTQALKLFLPLVSVRPLFAHVAKHNHPSLRALLRQEFKLTARQIKESQDPQALLELKLS